jgi:hypothetical protein
MVRFSLKSSRLLKVYLGTLIRSCRVAGRNAETNCIMVANAIAEAAMWDAKAKRKTAKGGWTIHVDND